MYSYEPCYCHCLNCIFYFRATGFLIQHYFNCKETFQGIKYHSASIQRRKKPSGILQRLLLYTTMLIP